jgi:methionyl-tRNA formyltransferase
MADNKQAFPRIVFMGTPEFAVASLDALVQAGFDIAGVITAPDKPAGRGMQVQQSAVKKYAVDHGLHVLQPEKLKNPEFLDQLRSLKADVQVVVAFRMLPEVVWNMPPMGTINLHASLLPNYRGAAPINWAVIEGEKVTGVTTFKLKHEIDTGNVLLQKEIPIGDEETAGELHDRMKTIGGGLLAETIQQLAAGTLTEMQQAHMVGGTEQLKHAPKIFTDTCKIDWNQPVESIYNLIRGLSPYPAAFTSLNGKQLKIFRAAPPPFRGGTFPNDPAGVGSKTGTSPGSHETDGKSYLRFAASDGYIYVTELQLEGKKKMNVEDFLRGFRA